MYVGEIEVQPPLQEWLAKKYDRARERHARHVALKRGGLRGWSGFAEAIEAETIAMDRSLWPGNYTAIPVEALRRIMERLGDNAARVTVRAIDPEALNGRKD